MKTIKRLFTAFLMLVLSFALQGQEQPNLEQGLKRFGSYHGGNIDTISLSNGNVVLDIGLAQVPQRGGQLNLDYVLRYNGKHLSVNEFCDPLSGCYFYWDGKTGLATAVGTSLGVQMLHSLAVNLDIQRVVVGVDGNGQPSLFDVIYTVTTNDGAAHTADTGSRVGATQPGPPARMGDGSGILVPAGGNGFYDRHGVWHHSNFLETNPEVIAQDPNGNQILYGYSAQGPDYLLDTMGRTLPPAVSATTADFSGCTGPRSIVSVSLLNLPGVNGGTQTYKLCFVTVPIRTNFGNLGVGDAGNELIDNTPGAFIQSIVLPDGTAWTFEYDSRNPGDPITINYGDLTKITFPTGGTLSYTWGTVAFPSCGSLTTLSRTLLSRTLNANDGSGAHTSTYSYTVTSDRQIITTVTDPLGNNTVHTFKDLPNACAYYETQTQYFSGASTLLKTVNTAYTTSLLVAEFPTQRTTTWANGQVTRSQTSYLSIPAPDVGIVSDEYVYDYGQGAPGPLLLHTHTDHAFQGNSNYSNFNLIDRVSNQVTYDGAGNQIAQTTYGYDESALDSSGVTTGHNTSPANGVYRGNRTSVNRWLNSTAGFLTATSKFYDTGIVSQATDALGNKTTFTYSSIFVGAYLTQTQLPDTSTAGAAVHHVVSGDYDLNTGLLTKFTDQNGNSSTYNYDGSLRLTSANFPDGGKIQFNYPDPQTVEKKQLQNATANTWIDQFFYFDGLGRQKQTRLKDAAGDDLTDTTYDALGRVATVSNPYRAITDLTYGIAQTYYDALGRVTQVTKQDGGMVKSAYSGNTTTVTDEAGRQRRSASDGLGRLIEVDEPNPNTPATNATGWVAISGGDQTGSSNVSITVPNAGFETPGVGSGTFGAFQYSPSGGSWTFTGTGVTNNGAGISGNGSGFTSGNPAAPDGAQVAFLQGEGSTIYQTLSGFQAGASYAVSFYAAQRGNINNGGERFDVYLDNTLLASFFPASSSYGLLSTPAFSTTAGSHTLTFVGRDPSAWGNTAFIDAASVTGTATVADTGTVTITVNGTPYSYNYGAGDTPSTVANGLVNTINTGSLVTAVSSANADVTVPNAGFETPVVGAGAFQYTPAGGSWTFVGGAGITGNGSGFTSGNPPAPEGGQVAFLQVGSGSTISQTLSGFQAGVSYTVTFYAAQRGNFNNGGQDFDVYLDSTLLATFRPGSTSYNLLSTPAFNTTAGSHTLQFVGRDSSGGDNTAFIDAVRVSAANGSVISLTSVATGSSADYTLATSTTHSGNFNSPSFTSSASGATLTGGLNANDIGNNSYVTLYRYDALGNLLCVEQHGNVTGTGCGSSPTNDATSPWRVRRFTYDSLGRLLTANNPESGLISYFYDNAGNLLQKVMPTPNQTGSAQHTISYCYDELNRVTGKAYSWQNCQGTQLPAGTAVESFVYDQGANAKGKLASLTDQAGSASYTYDILGRMATETRVIAGVSKTMSYEYNLDGSLKILHYPSGAAVTYTPDSAGRILSAVDSGNAINYVTSATYGPDGALTGFVSGNSATFAGITNSFSFNQRLQPVFMSASAPSQTVFSIGYDFHLGAGNNGNVYAITNNRDHTRDQTFTYDALNRLTSAQNAGTDCAQTVLQGKTKFWGNNYGYDAWGNLLQKSVTKCAAENLAVTALNNNQLVGYSYDAAGNMTSDPTDGVISVYDQENRISTAGKNGVTTTYAYDSDGNRVQKSSGSTGTLYWYMAPGIVAESDLAGNLTSEYVFFDGERVARRDGVNGAGGVFYYFSDHLKTASVITDATGNIKSESDYYPWGGELQFLANDSNHYKFTGKERDLETGLDYFGARYYSNGLGRFITPDWAAKATAVPYADFGDPQSLNLYSYVRNIPSTKVDPDGHCVVDGKTYGAWWCFKHALGLAETDQEKQRRIEQRRQRIAQERNVLMAKAPSDAMRRRFERMSDTQIDETFTALVELAEERESNQSAVPPVAPGSAPTSPNQMQKQVERGQAPKSVDRVDSPRFPNEKPHVEFNDGNALNNDGTWKHGGRALTNAEKDWLTSNGWVLPK